jgi:hypothetical protein
MSKRNLKQNKLQHLRASRDAQRRAKIDETIAAFRGGCSSDRETLVRLAAEVVRLNRNIATLKKGVEQIIAGTEFILKVRYP